MTPRILAFGGALRRESFNQKLAERAAEGAREAGADVTVIALRDFPMPLYDFEIHAASGLPEEAKRLKALFQAHHGFIIASPEYNSSFSGALKNAIDWVSRSEAKDEPPLSAFKGKTAALLAASPGALGGLRGLVPLRMLLGNIGVHVLPDQVTIPNADSAFAPDGRLLDEKLDMRVRGLGAALARHLVKLLD
jgi:NAD(P)H-dependent FMN reductase